MLCMIFLFYQKCRFLITFEYIFKMSKKMSKIIIKKELVLVEESIKYGDINGNGKIDSADAVAIKKYLAGYSDTINEKAADVTGDGKIDVNDAIRLLKYLAGYDVTLGAA